MKYKTKELNKCFPFFCIDILAFTGLKMTCVYPVDTQFRTLERNLLIRVANELLVVVRKKFSSLYCLHFYGLYGLCQHYDRRKLKGLNCHMFKISNVKLVISLTMNSNVGPRCFFLWWTTSILLAVSFNSCQFLKVLWLTIEFAYRTETEMISTPK